MATKTRRKASKKKASKKSKGVSVILAELSGNQRELFVKSGTTLGVYLKKAGIDAGKTGKTNDIRVNGGEEDMSFRLHKNDFVTIAPRVQGGIA